MILPIRAEACNSARTSQRGEGSINLRTQFERIITKAGVRPLPRLFHNMRASCVTEWAAKYPARDVAAWLGHSPLIAAQHYLQAQDVYMDLAAGVGEAAANPATHARPSDTTHDHDENRRDHRESEKSLNTSELVECGRVCDRDQKEKTSAGAEVMTPMGFELPANPTGNPHVSDSTGHKSGNIGADSSTSKHTAPIPPAPPPLPADPDLAAIVAAWPTLPNAIKAGVLALVHAATDRPTPSPSSPKADSAA